MSFIPKNPLSIPEIESTPSTPPGTRGLFAKEDGWYDVDSTGKAKKIATDDLIPNPDVLEHISNKTTNISQDSTNEQYPSAKAVVDYVRDNCSIYVDGSDIDLSEYEKKLEKLPGLKTDKGEIF